MREIIPRSIDESVSLEIGAAYKPLRPAPNLITAGDLHDYTNLLDPLILSLGDDAVRTLATGDAAKMNAEADALDAEAKKFDSAGLSVIAESLRKQAAARRKLASTVSAMPAEQVKAQSNFLADYGSFLARWQPVAAKMRGTLLLTSGGDWTTLQGYDLEYQNFNARYESMGFKSTMGVPPSAPDTPSIPVTNTLKTIATIAGIGLVAFIAVQVVKK